MMIGAVLVLLLGAREWLDKRFLDSIEKARLLGPQLQPNDFGAFLVYIAGPFLGLFVTQMGRVRAWLLAPYLALLAKILLATFSRGAFIGMALAGVAAGYLRGRFFLLGMGLVGAGLLVAMPQLVPESLAERMSQTTTDTGFSEELDASSQTRLVLWKAAIDMSLESPLLGKGFKAFPRLKGQYTETDVPESDNHNMFLYISSQMGIPALLLFLWLLHRTWALGVRVYRAGGEAFGRAIGMGGAAMVAGLVAVNMFGSRMVDIGVNAYFWIYLAVLAHLWLEIEPPERPAGAGVEAGP
jgi:O-antigen ligase